MSYNARYQSHYSPAARAQQRRLWIHEWLSRLALGASVLLFIAAAMSAIKQHFVYLDSSNIQIVGGTDEMRANARAILQEGAGQSLLDLDLHEWKQRLENLPGVAQAHLRRVPPHALLVRLENHQPLARWAQGGLIDVYGARYDGVGDLSLPVFDGPLGSVHNMIAFFEEAETILDSGAASGGDDSNVGKIMQLELSARGEWQVFLDNGIILYLGREKPRARVRLYVRHARELQNQFAQLRGVDLRYEHGFTIINHADADVASAAANQKGQQG